MPAPGFCRSVENSIPVSGGPPKIGREPRESDVIRAAAAPGFGDLNNANLEPLLAAVGYCKWFLGKLLVNQNWILF